MARLFHILEDSGMSLKLRLYNLPPIRSLPIGFIHGPHSPYMSKILDSRDGIITDRKIQDLSSMPWMCLFSNNMSLYLFLKGLR